MTKNKFTARIHPENFGSNTKPMLSDVKINGVPVDGVVSIEATRDRVIIIFDANAMEFEVVEDEFP